MEKVEEKPKAVLHELVPDIEDVTDKEHKMSFAQAIKLYPKAVAWSVMMSTALIMDGYDLKLIGSLFAQPAFRKAYGQMIRLAISGYVCEKYGFRKTMTAALAIVPGIIFIQFFAPSLGVLETAQVLLGIPLGMFQTITCVYAIEVMPTTLRGYLTSYVNMCWLFGQLIASGVLRGTLHLPEPWTYRVPFAIQWFWPMPLMIGAFLAPESPWWLVRQGKLADAEVMVRRLTTRSDPAFDVSKNVRLMGMTTEHERELNAGIHFVACFRGTDLRRTIIVIGCYCMQVLSGSTLRAYATFFLQQGGLPTDQAFNMSIVIYALGIAGVITSWFLMYYIGRRTLFICGLAILAIIYCIIGGIGVRQATHPAPGLAWGVGSLLLASGFIANATVGAVSYTLVSEIPSSLLRSKSVVIARFCYAAINIAANVITPYQLGSAPPAWNWSSRSGFWWCGSCVLGLIFTYFMIPESKGRTIAELDLLFEQKISARKFTSAHVSISDIAVDERRS